MATIPKLALIPSGVKATKVYSVLPTDGTGDFTFDRNLNTATRVNSQGLIEMVAEDVPRLNYPLIDGVVQGCPSLLLEPLRTNLVTYSEEFDNGAWSKTRSSINANQIISPSGILNADKFIENSDNNSHLLSRTTSVTAQDYVSSVFIKKGERKKVRLRFDNTLTLRYAEFDLENGVVDLESNSIASIENYGNGWYRCSIKVTATATTFYTVLQLLSDNGDLSYQGDGISGIYIWGAQVEAGTYATSYIPTTSAISTRSAETCNGAGDASTFNDSEGVLFAEISTFDDTTIKIITIGDGTSSNRIQLFYFNGASIYGSCIVGGVSQASLFTNIDVSTNIKVAFKYKINDFALWINGFEVGIDTSGTVPNGLNTLRFDSGVGTSNFYGNVKQIQYFNTALSDEELTLLTTL